MQTEQQLTKQEFNNKVYTEQSIVLHPNNTAIYQGKKYKILPIKPEDENVTLEERQNNKDENND